MYQVLAPFKAQLIEQYREHLEVVVLFVTNDIYHLVDRVVLETQFCCSDILCHIYRSTIRTQQQFLVETLACEVCPY